MTLAEIKENLNRNVSYNGHTYKLNGCMIRKDEVTNAFKCQAELLDTTSGRSVIICRPEEVEKPTS